MTTAEAPTTPRRFRLGGAVVLAIGAVLLATLLSAYGPATHAQGAAATRQRAAMSASHPTNAKQAVLYTAMRGLWEQHMEWTYATVAAYADGSPGLTATLHRLLRNQTDIGDAVQPFYGTTASGKLTNLLKKHINDAVPVLKAAKAGNTAALNKAVNAWYANAQKIANFLAAANPHWGKKAMGKMMRTHITQTIAYASDQLEGHYAASIKEYNKAEAHMLKMADVLSRGLILQFPNKF